MRFLQHIRRNIILAALMLAGAAAAVASISASGFLAVDTTDSGLGSGTSAGGFIATAAAPAVGGSQSSASGFTSIVGAGAPSSPITTSVQDWSQIHE